MIRKKRTIPWNKFGQLREKNELDIYLNGYEYNHGKFCHYTNCTAINSILGSKSFYISNVSVFNDRYDSEQFGDTQQYFYSLCFSTGINENLALWYLYAGMKGDGGRIVFTPAQIKELIDTSKYYLAFSEINGKTPELKVPIVENTDFKRTFRDIIYYQDSKDNNTDLKYNTMTNYRFPKSEFDKYRKEYIGFCKNLIWYYEKETRLLIEITNTDLKRKINEILKNKNRTVKVIMEFDDKIYKNISLDFAPEIKDLKEISYKFENIKYFIDSTLKANLSKYHGKIKMNICGKCKNTPFGNVM